MVKFFQRFEVYCTLTYYQCQAYESGRILCLIHSP